MFEFETNESKERASKAALRFLCLNDSWATVR